MVISSIAIRLWMNQKKSAASNTPAKIAASRRPLANHTSRVKANSPNAPASALGSRQTSGVSPSQRIAAASTVLPTIGCSAL